MADIYTPRGANTVGLHGAYKMPSQSSLAAIPYKYRPYPSVRYGPNGQSKMVQDEQEAAQLGEDWRVEPWSEAAKPEAPRVSTVESLQADLSAQTRTFDMAYRQLHRELDRAQQIIQAQEKLIAGQREQIDQLQAGPPPEAADEAQEGAAGKPATKRKGAQK